MDGMREQPYYYVLSLGGKLVFITCNIICIKSFFPGDGKGKPPLPIAEFISTPHSLEQVQSWLNSFFLKLK